MNNQVVLIPVETLAQRSLAYKIVTTHHSYVPTFDSVGRRIDWLIYRNNELVGMIGIGSSVYPPCKDILTHLNLSKTEYATKFNSIANNWRFCLQKSYPNLGTVVLKELRKQAPILWWKQYHDKLDYIITFVGANHTGAVYKADNWTHIGYTAGLPKHQAVSMKWDTQQKIAEKFVTPVGGEERKLIFISKKLTLDTKNLLYQGELI